jgi:hypothetical protein
MRSSQPGGVVEQLPRHLDHAREALRGQGDGVQNDRLVGDRRVLVAPVRDEPGRDPRNLERRRRHRDDGRAQLGEHGRRPGPVDQVRGERCRGAALSPEAIADILVDENVLRPTHLDLLNDETWLTAQEQEWEK